MTTATATATPTAPDLVLTDEQVLHELRTLSAVLSQTDKDHVTCSVDRVKARVAALNAAADAFAERVTAKAIGAAMPITGAAV